MHWHILMKMPCWSALINRENYFIFIHLNFACNLIFQVLLPNTSFFHLRVVPVFDGKNYLLPLWRFLYYFYLLIYLFQSNLLAYGFWLKNLDINVQSYYWKVYISFIPSVLLLVHTSTYNLGSAPNLPAQLSLPPWRPAAIKDNQVRYPFPNSLPAVSWASPTVVRSALPFPCSIFLIHTSTCNPRSILHFPGHSSACLPGSLLPPRKTRNYQL